MEYVAKNEDGTFVRYVDNRRWFWLASLALPIVPLSAYALFFASGGNSLFAALPLVYFFVLVPALDAIVGGDTHNPPEVVAPALSRDRFYEIVAYLMIPAHFFLFLVTVWFVGAQSLPIWAIAALAIGVGSINGSLINIAHELGHKTDFRNRFFAKLSLALSGYGHFTIEHNRGHHIHVATPEDCASARYGESVYEFAARELPGAFLGGWRQEIKRLRKKNLPALHWENEIVQVYALTMLITIGLVAVFGWKVAPFIIAHHFFSWYGLTQVNYIEHYGLLRAKRPNGRYEKCQPRHSWNSNHTISNLLTLHLQRHSDHHAYPMRPYQALRDYKDVPCLPSGYPGCLVLAAVPPLWFKVMNPKVLDWAGGDYSKINVTDPVRRGLV